DELESVDSEADDDGNDASANHPARSRSARRRRGGRNRRRSPINADGTVNADGDEGATVDHDESATPELSDAPYSEPVARHQQHAAAPERSDDVTEAPAVPVVPELPTAAPTPQVLLPAPAPIAPPVEPAPRPVIILRDESERTSD
ncbi:MAG: hypothetical protein JZU59_17845, partial [Chromatium okenii]|nr:hypothetical protein [Chromatium okenii]